LSPRLILPAGLPICLLILNCGYDLSSRDSSLKANSQPANSQAVQEAAPANQQQENGPEAATSTSERAKLNAEEAALRHKALMRAHRKRIIETGKNDHAPTPEEYSPELELYKKPSGAAPQAIRNQLRNYPAIRTPAVNNNGSNQVELRTDIRLESEKPGQLPPAGTNQYVSKRMHSEGAHDAKDSHSYIGPAQSDSSQPHSPAIDFKPYMAELSKKIKQNWAPPARQDKTQVSVKVNFIVMPDGAIGNLRISKHGSPSADEAARQAILRAAPFAPLPQGCNVPKQIDYDFSHSSHQDEPSFQWGIH
jgi:TonB family protein